MTLNTIECLKVLWAGSCLQATFKNHIHVTSMTIISRRLANPTTIQIWSWYHFGLPFYLQLQHRTSKGLHSTNYFTVRFYMLRCFEQNFMTFEAMPYINTYNHNGGDDSNNRPCIWWHWLQGYHFHQSAAPLQSRISDSHYLRWHLQFPRVYCEVLPPR